MSETTDKKRPMPSAVERLVLHWGEMGSVWGVNRSVGQIHALLYLSERPLTAEEIADTLGLARSNISSSLRELQGWGLVRRVHVMGDRRDYFEAESDIWEMVTRIAEGRKAREIDPTLAVLETCAAEAESDRRLGATSKRRIGEMLELVRLVDRWSADIRRLPAAKLAALLRLGSAVVRLLPSRGARPRGSRKRA